MKYAACLALFLLACGDGETLWLGSDRASLSPDAGPVDAGPPFDADAGDGFLPPGAPREGIFLYWQLDDDSLTTAFDASGNGRDGTLANAPSPSDPAPVRRAHNTRGRFFNGTGETASYEGDVPFQAFTLALWVKPAVSSAATVLVRRNGAGEGMLELSIGPEGRFELHAEPNAVAGTCPAVACVIGARAVSVDQWFHVALSGSQDGTLRLYVDGGLEGESPLEAFANGGERLSLGTMLGASLAGLRGVIDEVIVYDRVLAPADVSALAARSD